MVKCYMCNCNCDCSCQCNSGFTQYRTTNMIVLATLAPVIQIEANHIYQRNGDTLECGRDFEVNRNCKKNLPCSLANGPQRIRKERTAGHRTLLCIGCTSVVQCERTVVVLGFAEMRNFSAAEYGKAISGNSLVFREFSRKIVEMLWIVVSLFY